MIHTIHEFIGTWYPLMLLWYLIGVLANAQFVATELWQGNVKDPERYFWLIALAGPALWMLVSSNGDTGNGFVFPGYTANRLRAHVEGELAEHGRLLREEPRYERFGNGAHYTWNEKLMAWRLRPQQAAA